MPTPAACPWRPACAASSAPSTRRRTSPAYAAADRGSAGTRAGRSLLVPGRLRTQVDEMLFRLYEPILWRSLGVANATGTAGATRAAVSRAVATHGPCPCVDPWVNTGSAAQCGGADDRRLPDQRAGRQSRRPRPADAAPVRRPRGAGVSIDRAPLRRRRHRFPRPKLTIRPKTRVLGLIGHAGGRARAGAPSRRGVHLPHPHALLGAHPVARHARLYQAACRPARV